MDIKSLAKGMTVEENFAVLSVIKKPTSNGNSYLQIELSHPTGTINGKVWQDNFLNVDLKPGNVYLIKGVVDSWRDINSINISNSNLVEEEEFENYITPKPTMVFDIETIGDDFKNLSKWDQDYLLNNLEKNEEDKEIAKQKTGLHPIYGQVVSIGMFNPNTNKGSILSLSETKIDLEDQDFTCLNFKTEKELLEKFWQICENYERFVTYNGSGFDFPFLIIRSAIKKIKIPFEINSRSERFLDLMWKFRTMRSYQLEALCRALKITNPKEEGVHGSDVTRLFNAGKIKDISDYVSRDARSTSQLYLVWKKYIAGKIVV